MEEKLNNDLKKSLLEALDIETSKPSDMIKADKVEAIVQLLETFEKDNTAEKSDSLEKFINKFNKTHNTSLTADADKLRKKEKLYECFQIVLFCSMTLSGIGIIISIRKMLRK